MITVLSVNASRANRAQTVVSGLIFNVLVGRFLSRCRRILVPAVFWSVDCFKGVIKAYLDWWNITGCHVASSKESNQNPPLKLLAVRSICDVEGREGAKRQGANCFLSTPQHHVICLYSCVDSKIMRTGRGLAKPSLVNRQVLS